MDEKPPPEANLIYERRKAQGLSFRQAGALAGISEGSWRRTEGAKELNRTAVTVGKMACAVGITPEEMKIQGQRPDAAEVMEKLRAPASGPTAQSRQELRTAAQRLIDLLDLEDEGDARGAGPSGAGP